MNLTTKPLPKRSYDKNPELIRRYTKEDCRETKSLSLPGKINFVITKHRCFFIMILLSIGGGDDARDALKKEKTGQRYSIQ